MHLRDIGSRPHDLSANLSIPIAALPASGSWTVRKSPHHCRATNSPRLSYVDRRARLFHAIYFLFLCVCIFYPLFSSSSGKISGQNCRELFGNRASFRDTVVEDILVSVLDNVLIILGLFWRIAKSIRGEGGGALRVRNLVMQFFRATNSTK